MRGWLLTPILLTVLFATTAFADDANSVTSKARVESAFSPDGRSEQLVLKVIQSANQDVRLAAYSFTSPTIVRALTLAKRRGMDVQVIVDDKGNRGKANIAALNLLVMAEIPVRKVSGYAIHHDNRNP